MKDPKEFYDKNIILAYLQEQLKKIKIIGIDGFMGSGKSCLSNFIKEKINFDVIKVDSFVIRNKGSYVLNIRYKDLEKEIQEKESINGIIIEGICLLQILEKIKKTLDILIYIKHYHQTRDEWLDEGEYNNLSRVSSPIGPLTSEIVEYCQKYQPCEKADIIYKRRD